MALTAATQYANRYGLNLKFYDFVEASPHSATATYEKDDCVLYNGVLYKANAAISTAGAFDEDDWTEVTEALSVDFANQVSVDISGDKVWATGNRAHANRVPFDDPMEGTLVINTQMMTTQLLAVIMNTTVVNNGVVFNNNSTSKFYIVTGETVWKDKDGNTYNENIVCYKASPRKAYAANYIGTGDPTELEVTFDLTENKSGDVYSSVKLETGD